MRYNETIEKVLKRGILIDNHPYCSTYFLGLTWEGERSYKGMLKAKKWVLHFIDGSAIAFQPSQQPYESRDLLEELMVDMGFEA